MQAMKHKTRIAKSKDKNSFNQEDFSAQDSNQPPRNMAYQISFSEDMMLPNNQSINSYKSSLTGGFQPNIAS